MQIVVDTGMDIPAERMAKLDVHVVRHAITLDGKTYMSGKDVQSSELYRMLEVTEDLPVTSQPSAGEIAEIYRELAQTDPEILSLHMSSGLSGVVNAAKAGARMVPEADVLIYDAKTLSAAYGWQVDAADRAAKAGWSREQIVALLQRISDASDSIYTLRDLTYLIHGGRISHMKGLIASALNIKPLIGVEKEGGTYVQLGMARTFERAVKGLIKLALKQHPAGSPMRVQIGHAQNPEGCERLRKHLDRTFDCVWLPDVTLAPVLGAHTGPTMVGMAYASMADFPELP